MQLRIRGITFEMIGRQLGCSRQRAYRIYTKALRAIPKASADEMRKLEGERSPTCGTGSGPSWPAARIRQIRRRRSVPTRTR